MLKEANTVTLMKELANVNVNLASVIFMDSYSPLVDEESMDSSVSTSCIANPRSI